MKKILLICLSLFFISCGDNDDGSSKSTYSSCKITSSDALFAKDRTKDLGQCWNASGNGYESEGDALAWCKREVNNYIADEYTFGHAVKFAVESTNCP